MTLPPSCAQNHAVPADRSSRSSMISCALDCTLDLRPLRLRPSKSKRGPWVCARVYPTTTFGSSSSRLKGPLTGDLVDANLLIYAHDSASAHHEVASPPSPGCACSTRSFRSGVLNDNCVGAD